jgi:hypothetical protein
MPKKSVEKNRVTVFLPISRMDRIEVMADQVNALETKNCRINFILIIVDNYWIDNDEVIRIVGNKYPVIIMNTGNKPPHEMNIGQRRSRITDVFNYARKLIPDTDFVFTIEDDTNIRPNYLDRLISKFNLVNSREYKVGFISGVQVGRWGFKMIGAWNGFDYDDLKSAQTIPYTPENGLQEVDAAGFYCYLTKKNLFVNTNYKFGQFGPDVYFGFDLRFKGYHNFIDWSLIAEHVTNKGILVPDKDVVVVKYAKDDKGIWQRVLPIRESINLTI